VGVRAGAIGGMWFWGRRRGNVWATDQVVDGAVCVRVREVRARVSVGDWAMRGAANFTNSSAVGAVASLGGVK